MARKKVSVNKARPHPREAARGGAGADRGSPGDAADTFLTLRRTFLPIRRIA